jgi:cyclic-di-GMP-binding protein
MFVASLFSFDIVSSFDEQELKNAVDQTRRDVLARYDLKDTKTEIELTDKEITINTEADYSLEAVRDILETKLVRRHLSLKILDYQDDQDASGGRKRQVVKLRQGIPEDIAKQLSKRIRDEFKKVTPQIQGDSLRVHAKSKDDLQTVITALKAAEGDYPVALQFTNYR